MTTLGSTSCPRPQPRAATIKGKYFCPLKMTTSMPKMPHSTSSSRVFKKSCKRARKMLQAKSKTPRPLLRYLTWKGKSHPRWKDSQFQMKMRLFSMWSSVIVRSANRISLYGRSIARSARGVLALTIIIAHGLETASENGIANLFSCFWSIKQLRYLGLHSSSLALWEQAFSTSTQTGILIFRLMAYPCFRWSSAYFLLWW